MTELARALGAEPAFARLLEITRDIIEAENLADGLDSIARGFLDLFAFRYCTIVAADNAQSDLYRRVMLGYPAEMIASRLHESVPRADIAAILTPAFEVFENCFYIPTEQRARWDRAIYADEARKFIARRDPGEWHEDDSLAFVLRDRAGAMIGYMSVDGPADGRVPDRDSLRLMQRYVNLVALALANARSVAAELERSRVLHREARHDALTGLPNRVALFELLNEVLAEPIPVDAIRPVLFIDLDEFKAVNDTLGHVAGDGVLLQIAQRLRDTIQIGDFVARLGGDEFAIVLGERPQLDDVLDDVAALQRRIQAPIEVEGRRFYLSASIGIAILDGRYGSVVEVLRDADIAMYQAKANGGARTIVFDGSMRKAAMRRLALTTELHEAIAREQFAVVFQPIVRLADGAVHAFEALMRWTHPERGHLGPEEFIAHAEQIGALAAIGRTVLAQAVEQLARWRRIAPGVGVHVNLAVSEILERDLDLFVFRLLETHAVPPSELTLEITEGALLRAHEFRGGGLERLRARGVRVAVDDFGTGYSALHYLEQFPIDVLKIDRSFIASPPPDAGVRAEPIVRFLIDLAGAYGIEAIAEGIETPEQAERVHALGCRLGQGFAFAPGLAPDEIVPMLQARRAASVMPPVRA